MSQVRWADCRRAWQFIEGAGTLSTSAKFWSSSLLDWTVISSASRSFSLAAAAAGVRCRAVSVGSRRRRLCKVMYKHVAQVRAARHWSSLEPALNICRCCCCCWCDVRDRMTAVERDVLNDECIFFDDGRAAVCMRALCTLYLRWKKRQHLCELLTSSLIIANCCKFCSYELVLSLVVFAAPRLDSAVDDLAPFCRLPSKCPVPPCAVQTVTLFSRFTIGHVCHQVFLEWHAFPSYCLFVLYV